MSLTPQHVERFPHLIIRASAGSGKTYQLIHRYLSLVAADAPVGSIFASTFTRLASGQIRDRILQRLIEAVESSEIRSDLASFLQCDEVSREDVLRLLRSFVSNLHRTHIQTLDSWFISVLRTFALELGLPLSCTIADDAEMEQVRQDAIRQLLDEHRPQSLVNLLRHLTQGSTGRPVVETIDRVVRDLLGVYQETMDDAWESIPPQRELTAPQLIDAIQELESYSLPDKKSLRNAHAGDVKRAYAHDWEALLAKGLAGKIVQGEDTFRNVKITSGIHDSYLPIVNHARAVLINRWRDHTLATRDLLRQYADQYNQAMRRSACLTFADVTAAMRDTQLKGQFDQICFRLDTTLQHILLDEFQDISVQQWNALLPLVREIISYSDEARSFFCVGDVKQSIYGWRDAAPEVFDSLPALGLSASEDKRTREQNLSVSYRSSPIIIGAVNRVFGKLADNEALRDDEKAAIAWASTFKKHSTAKEDLPGHVLFQTVQRAEEGQDQHTLRLEKAARFVTMIHQDYPQLEIAVLTRTNRTVARLMYEFSPARLNIHAAGKGGIPLTHVPPVTAILDLLQLADHPDDKIAAFHVAHSPLGQVVELLQEHTGNDRRQLASAIRRQLLDQGYTATISAWVLALAESCDEQQYDRLLELIELADRYDVHPSLRPSDFVKLVERERVGDAQPAPVQVMNVHQAKGLEFDLVVLPELEGGLVVGHPTVVFERDGHAGMISRICRHVNQQTRELVPELESLFTGWHDRAVRESLNLLYVAMTRAKQGLYVFVNPPAENEKSFPKTQAGVIRSALAESSLEPDTVFYEAGDPAWMNKSSVQEKAPSPEKSIAPQRAKKICLTSSQTVLPRGITTTAASAHDDVDGTVFIKPDITASQHEAFDHGTAIHKLLEQITWLEDWEEDTAGLQSLLKRTFPRRSSRWIGKCIEMFREILQQPDIRGVLSRGETDSDQYEVYCEYPFARIVSGRLQTGFIDRLVIRHGSDGTASLATIVDYKTDTVEISAAQEYAQRYHRQMEIYQHAVTEWWAVSSDKITKKLVFVHAGIVVEMA